jgi:predicted nucleic acid-binding protein
MNDRLFIDTNIWVYLYSDINKANKAVDIIEKNFNSIIISTQILTELFNVLIKKKIKSKTESLQIISEIASNFRIIELNKQIVLDAAVIANKLQYSIYDSLIITVALQNNCKYLISEDLQHNQIINGTLKIVNPFI